MNNSRTTKKISVFALLQFAVAIVLFLLPQSAFADEKTSENRIFHGFSGGMMLHTGYLFGENVQAPCNPQGATFGIGGALRVHLWNHLRVGSEGYMSSMPSSATDCHDVLQKGSYMRYGWGGVLADAYWRTPKAWPYIGATVGGGSVKSLYIVEGDQSDWQQEAKTVFNKRAFGFVSPFVGCDYLLTERVHLTFKVDWLLAFNGDGLVMPTGFRAYFGFMFCH